MATNDETIFCRGCPRDSGFSTVYAGTPDEFSTCGKCGHPARMYFQNRLRGVLNYFAGGPGDGLAIETHLLVRGQVRFPIVNYRWTRDTCKSDSGKYDVRIWEYALSEPVERIAMTEITTDSLRSIWTMLDDYYAEMLSNKAQLEADPFNEELKDKNLRLSMSMAAIAQVVRLLWPVYPDARSVSVEVVNRYRNKDNPEYTSPGLSDLIPPTVVPAAIPVPVAPAPVESKLTADQRSQVVQQMASGIFTAEMLAKAYGVNVPTIHAIVREGS